MISRNVQVPWWEITGHRSSPQNCSSELATSEVHCDFNVISAGQSTTMLKPSVGAYFSRTLKIEAFRFEETGSSAWRSSFKFWFVAIVVCVSWSSVSMRYSCFLYCHSWSAVVVSSARLWTMSRLSCLFALFAAWSANSFPTTWNRISQLHCWPSHWWDRTLCKMWCPRLVFRASNRINKSKLGLNANLLASSTVLTKFQLSIV